MTGGGATGGSAAPSGVGNASQVPSMLESRGYSNVTNVRPSADGGYTASATKNGESTTVTIDSEGNIR